MTILGFLYPILCALKRALVSRSLIFILLFVVSSLNVSAARFKDVKTEVSTLSLSVYYKTETVIDSFKSLKNDLPEKYLEDIKPYNLYFDAYQAYQNGQYLNSIELADSALSFFLWEQDTKWEAKCLLLLGFNSEALLIVDYALEYYSTAFELCPSEVEKTYAILGIARAKKRLKKDYQVELDYIFNHSFNSKFEELNLFVKRSYYWFNEDAPELVSVIDSVARRYLELDYKLFASACYKLLAYHFEDKDINKALVYANRALCVIENTKDKHTVFYGSINLYNSKLLLKQGQDSTAMVYINRSIKIHDELDLQYQNYYAYKRLANYYRSSSEFELADRYGQKAMEERKAYDYIERSANALLAQVAINRTYIERQLAKNRLWFYSKLFFCIALFVIVVVLIGKRYSKYLREKDIEISDLEKKKSDVESINSKLSVDNTRLNNENEVLSFLKEDLLSVVEKLEKEGSFTQAAQELRRRILSDPEFSKTIPDDFCKMYQFYMTNFTFRHSKLRASEARVAVMIVMGIPSRSIAKLLCVEPDTLKKYRHRIRKALNLKKGDDLKEYLDMLIYEFKN